MIRISTHPPYHISYNSKRHLPPPTPALRGCSLHRLSSKNSCSNDCKHTGVSRTPLCVEFGIHSRTTGVNTFRPSHEMATTYQRPMPLPPMAPETNSSVGHHLEQHHQQHYSGADDATRHQQRHQQPEHSSLKDPRLRIKTYKRVSKVLPPDPLTPYKQRVMKILTTVSTAFYFFLSVPFLSLVYVSLRRTLLLLFVSLKRDDWSICSHIHHHRKNKKKEEKKKGWK